MSNELFSQIQQLGQSIWYDNISRDLLRSGAIQKMIEAGEVRGITSNPSIFEKAIAGGDSYDADLQRLLAEQAELDVDGLYEALAIEDIRAAADALRPVHQSSDGADGYISLEVSPRLAHDTEGTVVEARRLAAAVDRPNLMIKVPATEAGLPAIRELLAGGLSINVTLIFSHEDWRRSAEAYTAGLEQFRAGGGDPARVASVASFFVSRLDTLIDGRLPEGSSLRGAVAVAYAKLAYAQYRDFFAGERFAALREAGARPQRLLWASTGTKNPDYNDLLYVEPLMGADTVNTMPPATLDALRDHGRAVARVGEGYDQARAVLDDLAEEGIDIKAVTGELKDAGVAAFMKSFDGLLAALAEKKQKRG